MSRSSRKHSRNTQAAIADAPEATVEETSASTPETNPLNSAAGRDWLKQQLADAEHEEKHGPNGAGWRFNETLRPQIEERAAFLRALVELLPAAASEEE